MDVIVYKYGLLPPTMNVELIDEQLKMFNQVRNKIVEAVRRHRDVRRDVDVIKDEMVGETAALVEDLNNQRRRIEESIKKRRQNKRSKAKAIRQLCRLS